MVPPSVSGEARTYLPGAQALGEALPVGSSLPESPVRIKVVMSSWFLEDIKNIYSYIAFDFRKVLPGLLYVTVQRLFSRIAVVFFFFKQ